ncbi:MAG: TonB-dependent receptor, partial [bacterium]
AIDPMTVEKIEVLRGPETFLYGPGVLGGVINVDRKIIPKSRPERISGTVTFTGESVSLARGAGVTLDVPVGPLALRLDGSLRRSLDVNTPEGLMRNTGTYTGNGIAGLGWNHKDVTAGVAAEQYVSDYGIPGGFVGAHPNGVDIRMRRRHTAFRTAWTPGFSMLSRVEVEGDLNEYSHAEYESTGALGMGFDVTTADLDFRTLFGNHGVFTRGAAGISLENRDYKTSGLTFTPASRERTAAIYLFEERNVAPWRVQASLRADVRQVRPESKRTSLIIGDIRDRDFQGMSGAISIQRVVHPGWSVSLTVIRSWRAPMVEELYSEGPHLAAYSYEIGNPALDPEKGTGVELGVTLRKTRIEGKVAVFLNRFDTYIFPSNTGRYSPRRADLYEYQYEGVAVQMHGAEGNLRVELSEHWDVNLSGSYVRGERRTNGVPLPMMPPLSGSLGFDHHLGNWTLTFDFRGVAGQNRVDKFEQPTSAWLRLDLGVQTQQVLWGVLHTVSVEVMNAGNASYRQHLSRIKVILPEPGRNLRIVYRLHF